MKLIPIENNKNYYADRLGNIYSKNYNRTGVIKKLKPGIDGCGYSGIIIYGKRYLVHRLIAITYIKNKHNKRTVNHKDGNKSNNSVDNLEWMTYSENALHAYSNLNRVNAFFGLTGDKSPYAKSIVQKDFNGNIVKKWGSINEAGRNGFNCSSICKCLKGKRNHHKYFKWEYYKL
jgi:hypothetical protein